MTKFRAFRVFTKTGSAAAVVISCGYSLYYRPIPDKARDSLGPSRNCDEFLSPRNVPELPAHPWVLFLPQLVVSFCTVNLCRAFMHYAGEFSVIYDRNYFDFIKRVVNRENNAPLITIANHRSVLDEPCVMSATLPYHLSFQPRYLRWNICTQEICYNEKLPRAFHAYVGLGHVLPILRGGGIDQKLLLDFARLSAKGEWLHLFPEAGVWQEPQLGGRTGESERQLGKLKWGVGKLIAHSPRTPVVIPFFHTGMETIMPQDPVTRKVLVWFPRPGHRVRVLFGPEIKFDDLISEHERQYGPLWRYPGPMTTDEKIGQFHEYWDSKPHERVLYHKIALRVQLALEELNERSRGME